MYQSGWTAWTFWMYSRPVYQCAGNRVCISSSAAKSHISAECVNQIWRPGLASTLCGRVPPQLTSPLSLSILNPPPTPFIPPPPSPALLLCPPTPNWLWKMVSVSHLGTEIKAKLQPTSMQNIIWKAPSYVLTIDSSFLSSSHSVPFSSFPCFPRWNGVGWGGGGLSMVMPVCI